MRRLRRITTWTLSLLTISSASTLLTVDPEKRLKAKISKDSMNRLAVKGDRIISVFGDNEAYDIQTEETSGQVFIKPHIENGEKPLSLTVMTENNVVQDLSLEPIQKEASTLILTSSSKQKSDTKGGFETPQFGFEGFQNESCFKSKILKTMKFLVLERGEETAVDKEEEKRPSAKGVEVKCLKAFSLNGMRGVLYEVKNTNDDIADLKAEQFYVSGDLALSLKTDKLVTNQITYLYAVRS